MSTSLFAAEAANAAANWWADAIRSDTDHAPLVLDFRNHLYLSITQALQLYSDTVHVIFLRTNYEPVELLANIANDVGLLATCPPFPSFVYMWVSPLYVDVIDTRQVPHQPIKRIWTRP
ncbi:MAG: hypothetical protein EPN91_02235 [Salinibacterium sp.]|nr:MAG: hypothetical protein EPN91_02235 [Salinibacterium sp.]